MEDFILNDREKAILRYVIHQFILTANPVGSRNIAKKYEVGYSPATIRNVMADLEEQGFLKHPHTSAGRLPTDRGYRYYVDSLMDPPEINEQAKSLINSELSNISSETNDLLRLTATILSELTNQLACVTFPKFENSVLKSIQIVPLSSSRILVVVAIESGMVKTITLEIDSTVSSQNYSSVQQFLNERLSGLKFKEIRETLKDRLLDFSKEQFKPIIRLFIDSVDKIFKDSQINDQAYITGAKNIVKHPEFEGLDKLKGVIELIEDKDVIVHLMDSTKSPDTAVNVAIGKESREIKFSDYSTITTEYSIGEATGTVGIMGPKRMEYSRMIATVVYIAEQLSKELKNFKW